MTPLVVVELEIPGSKQRGRAFLAREHWAHPSIDLLERELSTHFVEAEDPPRLCHLERIVSSGLPIRTTVHPGFSSPPEYHAYLHDPESNAPLLACVLAPLAVIVEMIAEPPHAVFETATFQAIGVETTPFALCRGLEEWASRVWPNFAKPEFDLHPWPIETVEPIAQRDAKIAKTSPNQAPEGALPILEVGDYPNDEELRAS